MYYRRFNITVFIEEKIRMRFLKGTGYYLHSPDIKQLHILNRRLIQG